VQKIAIRSLWLVLLFICVVAAARQTPSEEQGSTEARFSRTVTSGPWSSRFILTSEGLMRR
jgi:hypothetical protein